MTASPIWFFLLLALALGLLALGRGLGGQSRAARTTAFTASLLLSGTAMVPRFYPAVLYTTIPLGVAIHLEGLLGTFPWMVLVGLLWAGRFSQNLRRAARLMVVLGLVYFLFGGVWMVRTSVRSRMKRAPGRNSRSRAAPIPACPRPARWPFADWASKPARPTCAPWCWLDRGEAQHSAAPPGACDGSLSRAASASRCAHSAPMR